MGVENRGSEHEHDEHTGVPAGHPEKPSGEEGRTLLNRIRQRATVALARRRPFYVFVQKNAIFYLMYRLRLFCPTPRVRAVPASSPSV